MSTTKPAKIFNDADALRALPGLILSLLFVALAYWSWGKWTDAHIDFGNELYIAWRLAEGADLYVDIAHRNGPLSHYVNALLFSLFGASLRTLVLCNLAIFAGICALVFAILRAPFGRAGATLACSFLLIGFGFSQYTTIANFNYITPYQHYQTHGLALGLLMILALGRIHALQQLSQSNLRLLTGWSAIAGACLGLVFLGKAELFVPAAVCAGTGLLVVLRAKVDGAFRIATAFGVAAALPVLLGLALLATQMPFATALEGIAGNWAHLGESVWADAFYRANSGLANWPENARLLATYAVGVGLFAVLCAGMDRALLGRQPVWLGVLAGAAVAGFFLQNRSLVTWYLVPRALPLTTALALACLWLPALRRQLPARLRENWFPLALWSAYALVLLGKMILKVRFSHYGFVLAMPATLLLVGVLFSTLPDALRERFGGGRLARGLAAGTVVGLLGFLWTSTDGLYQRKDFAFGSGRDAMRIERPGMSPRGPILEASMAELRTRMQPDQTLLVMPEGIMVNYLLRRINPIRFNLFLPIELAAFGGDAAVVEELEAHPPDYVLLVHRAEREFGVQPFGVDPLFGKAIMAWLNENYDRIGGIGAEPFTSRGFGTITLRRKSAG